jgi:hypothetical protein
MAEFLYIFVLKPLSAKARMFQINVVWKLSIPFPVLRVWIEDVVNILVINRIELALLKKN